jgi:hypothetical protein
VTDLMAIASAALGLTLSDPVPLAGSDRSSVLRCRTSANGTVVVKSYPASESGAEGFAAEYAGLTFIAGTGAGPDLLAADGNHRVIVMSDLGTAPSLADLLLGAAPDHAAGALLDWALACGDLAVRTAGRRQVFVGPATAGDTQHWLERRIWQVPGLLSDLSIEVPSELDDDLWQVASLLTASPFEVFSPGDICPDNNLITAAGVKFIDFESAGLYSAFLDAAYLRMPFSTCWCVFRLPDELARSAEACYRDLLSGTYPELAADEIWQPGVRKAMAAWTLHAMTYLLDRSVVADESMNCLARHAPTRRQLLRYRWQRLGEELDQSGELPAISALMSSLLAATQSWHAPGLPLYPAFS